MTKYSYDTILSKAKSIKKSVESEYKLGENTKWAYYICKAIIKPKNPVKKITVNPASSTTSGDYISNQIKKNEYWDMAHRLVEYCEKHNQLPNYISVKLNKTYKVNLKDYTYMFARILVYIANNNKYPAYANVNSKAFTKPTETTTKIFKLFIDTFGKVTTFTGALLKIRGKGYGYYFEDVLSNVQVISGLKSSNGKKPNCVDVCQMMWNVAKGLGYDVRCLQVWCPKDKITHVRLQVKHPKYTNGEWENYDPAAVIDGESVNSLWCAGSGSYTIATNPSWFMENLRR